MVGGAPALSRVPGAPRLPCGHPPPLSHPRAQGGPLGPRGAPAPRASGSGEISKGRAGAGAAALPALVRSSTPRSPMSQLPLYLTPRPGRAAPLVRDLHRAQPALARQPAQGAARVPGRRRHGWHVRCMSFTGFWLYRPERRWLSSPPGLCHPSASSVGPRQKNRGDPERAPLIERPSPPELHLRLPRLPPPSSTLPTAVRAGLRNLHTAFNMGKGKGAPENPALAHAPDSSRAQLTLALTLRFSSLLGRSEPADLRDHQPP